VYRSYFGATTLGGVQGISRCYPKFVKEQNEWVLATRGTNLSQIMSYAWVDRRTTTNHITEVENVLGIVAAYTVMCVELRRVISGQLDDRHVRLLAAMAMHLGSGMGFHRSGLVAIASPLLRMSFEEAVKVVVTSAIAGKVDLCKGVTETGMLSISGPAGTGSVDVRSRTMAAASAVRTDSSVIQQALAGVAAVSAVSSETSSFVPGALRMPIPAQDASYDATSLPSVVPETQPLHNMKLQQLIPMSRLKVNGAAAYVRAMEKKKREDARRRVAIVDAESSVQVVKPPLLLHVPALEEVSRMEVVHRERSKPSIAGLGAPALSTRARVVHLDLGGGSNGHGVGGSEEAERVRLTYVSFLQKVYGGVERCGGDRGVRARINTLICNANVMSGATLEAARGVAKLAIVAPAYGCTVAEWCMAHVLRTYPSDTTSQQLQRRRRTQASSSSDSSSSLSRRNLALRLEAACAHAEAEAEAAEAAGFPETAGAAGATALFEEAVVFLPAGDGAAGAAAAAIAPLTLDEEYVERGSVFAASIHP